MAANRKAGTDEQPTPPRRRATTLEGRENELVSLAVDLAEKQLRQGTASVQVVTHYLKLATTRERLEQTRLQGEIELTKAKIESIQSAARIEELYTDAIAALRSYRGTSSGDEQEFYEDD